MDNIARIKCIIRKQVEAWGFAYTVWFYIAATAAITLFTLTILFI